MHTNHVKNNILQHKKKRIKLKPLSKEAVYRSLQEITKILMKGINIRSTTGGQQRRGTFARSRYSSIQQRQYRLRSYGVSSAYGDGQMLLPMNSSNSNQVNSNQSSSEIPMTTSANLTHRHINSSQQNNMGSESQRRRIPISITTSTLTPISTSIMTTTSTSTSTSTSITTSTATNNHQRSHPLGLQN